MENNSMEQDYSDDFFDQQRDMTDYAFGQSWRPQSTSAEDLNDPAATHVGHSTANYLSNELTMLRITHQTAIAATIPQPKSSADRVNAVKGQVITHSYHVLDRDNFDPATVNEVDLNSIFLSVILGSHYGRGFDGWYLVREEKRFRESPLPALWAHPECMFVGTLQEAHAFLQPNATGPVHALVREVVGGGIQGREYVVDAVTGKPVAHTSSYASQSPTFEDFVRIISNYRIYNNVIGPNIDTAQQSLYYPRIKSTGFTCQPQGQQDFKPSFMTFLLGVDAAFSSILYWPTTRFRILQIAMTIGNGLTLSHSQQLFANAVLERVRSRHQYKGTIIQSAHQRACFEEYWTRAGQPLIPSAEQWNQVEKLRNSQEELHSVRIMSGQVSAELSAAYDLFVPLVSFDKTYGFSGITSSTPAFATTGRSQRPAIGMQPMPQEQFDVVLMEFESNAENALLVLQNGLDQLNLAREVEQLQVMP